MRSRSIQAEEIQTEGLRIPRYALVSRIIGGPTALRSEYTPFKLYVKRIGNTQVTEMKIFIRNKYRFNRSFL
jgi:hypothetical protein